MAIHCHVRAARWLPIVTAGAFATSGTFGQDAPPAFPGAEGFGTHTPGGRGGRVIEVTNLTDRGPRSLRAAVEADGPRMVVFRTAGTIEVDAPLQITNLFVTIAGRSTAGGGITLKNSTKNTFAPLQIKTDDVVIRYLRSHPGARLARPTDRFARFQASTVQSPVKRAGGRRCCVACS